jgi:hypothetical protein
MLSFTAKVGRQIANTFTCNLLGGCILERCPAYPGFDGGHNPDEPGG